MLMEIRLTLYQLKYTLHILMDNLLFVVYYIFSYLELSNNWTFMLNTSIIHFIIETNWRIRCIK